MAGRVTREQTQKAPDTRRVGGFCVFSAELVSVTVTVAVVFLGRLVDDSRLGGVELQP
jgi:hypothetical protein